MGRLGRPILTPWATSSASACPEPEKWNHADPAEARQGHRAEGGAREVDGPGKSGSSDLGCMGPCHQNPSLDMAARAPMHAFTRPPKACRPCLERHSSLRRLHRSSRRTRASITAMDNPRFLEDAGAHIMAEGRYIAIAATRQAPRVSLPGVRSFQVGHQDRLERSREGDLRAHTFPSIDEQSCLGRVPAPLLLPPENAG